MNRLRDFFNARSVGRGIWKWDHYFEIYDRDFSGFRGQEVHVLEIGVYSGGSLDMWRDYFGPKAHIYGVDIEPACKVYETDGTRIFIGDQADRSFWQEFRRQVPVLDIVIDDGGHLPAQQRVSLEELLPDLRGGGVYVCEDVHGVPNDFAKYLNEMASELNAAAVVDNGANNDRRLYSPTTPLQATIISICLYPFVAVVEKRPHHLAELVAPKHGDQWQPYLT